MGARPSRYAVIGNPIAHSRSPDIHTQFAAQCGIALTYERLLASVDGFDAAIDAFFAGGGGGLNVTVPFKRQAWERAAGHLSARAQAAGAVNTLWQRDGALHGCNTDGVGLMRDLTRLGVTLNGRRVLMLGAGGAARGALAPLLQAGCRHLRIANRTEARAAALAQAFADVARAAGVVLDASGFQDCAHVKGWDVIINATASGLQDAAPPLPRGVLADGQWAYDMVYGSRPTPFLLAAAAAGARTADGLGMLVEQAAESFYLWHGCRPDTTPVVATLRGELDRATRA